MTLIAKTSTLESGYAGHVAGKLMISDGSRKYFDGGWKCFRGYSLVWLSLLIMCVNKQNEQGLGHVCLQKMNIFMNCSSTLTEQIFYFSCSFIKEMNVFMSCT